MKRIITLLMVLAMVMSLSATAFASDLGESKDVTAKYEQNESEQPIYNVDLNWGDLTFTYTETVEKVWNPDSHPDATTTTGSWDKTESTVTVTNHSNVSVAVSMSVTPAQGTGVDVSLTGGNATLAAGEVGNVDGAASVTGTVKVSGKPNSTVTEDGIKVASITVTIQ